MSESIVPESRIFRIGRECYVAYLGNERDDVRPFLRIGNSRDIPDEVLDAISTTVITDDHVGNPLLEVLIAPKFHGMYLGDTGVVGTIRRFFKSFDLPVDDITDFHKVRDGERRHMVWFYSSGNIHLRYDDQVIFDLDRREKEDRHFVRLYEEAKGEFLRNPLRYIRQDFSGQGVVLAEGNAFWYEAGELLSFSAHPGFVAVLMTHGIDPDFITASAFDLTPSTMDSHEAAVFIGFIKRLRQRRKQLRVMTTEPELMRKVKLLFPPRNDTPATVEVTDVSGKKKATFRESIISVRDGRRMVHRAGLPGIVLDSEPSGGVTLDVKNGFILCGDAASAARFESPAGFPIEFIGHEPSDQQLFDRYIGFVLGAIRDHLSETENQAVLATERFLRMIRDDLVAGKASTSPLLKQTATAARDELRRCSPDPNRLSWFFLSNARALAGRLMAAAGEQHGLYRTALTVEEALAQVLDRMGRPAAFLPFWGDLYLGDHPILLWRATRRSFVPADITTTMEVNDRIRSIADLNETPWHDDLDRLLRLIRSLKTEGGGPLTDEEVALLAASAGTESERERNRTDRERRETHLHPASIGHEAGAVETGSVPDKPVAAKGRHGSGRGGFRWWWLLLALLLLLAGAAVWDVLGTAPWGQILRFGPPLSSDVRPSGDDRETDTVDTTMEQEIPETVIDSSTDQPESVSQEVDVSSNEQTDTGNAGGDSGVTETPLSTAVETVDVDVAPRTMEQVVAYLDVAGRVAITEADIHLAANEIAVINGYKDLDYRVFTGADPDWIYPGSVLKMPDAEPYLIRSGDTIWFLAARTVRMDVENDLAVYDSAVKVLKDASSDPAARGRAVAELESIARQSKAAAMRRIAAAAL